jgi:EAL domain-containing protein (putative c-di-GMP-specific phosphodiesterase class I)
MLHLSNQTILGGGSAVMTRQSANSDAAPRQASFSDVFVIFSVTLMSLAAGAGLLAQLGLAIWWAMVGALAVYAMLLSLHLVARRQFAAIDRAATAHLQAEIDALVPSDGELAQQRLDAAFNTASLASLPGGDELPTPWNIAPAGPRSDRGIVLPEPRDTEPFDFRPSQGPSLELPDPGQPSEQAAPSRTERSIAAAEQEVNVEYIQELIKKLADELNGPVQAPLPEGDATKASAAADADGMIGRSVEALETTARGMRTPPAADAAKPAATVSSWWPTLPVFDAPADDTARAEGGRPPTLNPQLARIAEAVASERIEVLLEPIQALAEGRTRHFEVSVRLLTADGAALEQSEFARAAQGSGLMPRIDAERMIRAARVARRLGERGRQGSVLSAIAGESLADAEFVGTASANTGDGRMNLVLSFAQSEVRNFTAGHAEALGQLAKAGFRFALEEVTDLDMDFGGLQAMGFDFVKLDAPVFLEGLAAPGGVRVPASDICRHLSDFGLTLIVGRIEDDWLLARILGFGVLFGKGTLFGGPKLVKPEVVGAAAAA